MHYVDTSCRTYNIHSTSTVGLLLSNGGLVRVCSHNSQVCQASAGAVCGAGTYILQNSLTRGLDTETQYIFPDPHYFTVLFTSLLNANRGLRNQDPNGMEWKVSFAPCVVD